MPALEFGRTPNVEYLQQGRFLNKCVQVVHCDLQYSCQRKFGLVPGVNTTGQISFTLSMPTRASRTTASSTLFSDSATIMSGVPIGINVPAQLANCPPSPMLIAPGHARAKLRRRTNIENCVPSPEIFLPQAAVRAAGCLTSVNAGAPARFISASLGSKLATPADRSSS